MRVRESKVTYLFQFSASFSSRPSVRGREGGREWRRSKLKQKFRGNNHRIPWWRLTGEKAGTKNIEIAHHFSVYPASLSVFPLARAAGVYLSGTLELHGNRDATTRKPWRISETSVDRDQRQKGARVKRRGVEKPVEFSAKTFAGRFCGRSFLLLDETIDGGHPTYVSSVGEKSIFVGDPGRAWTRSFREDPPLVSSKLFAEKRKYSNSRTRRRKGEWADVCSRDNTRFEIMVDWRKQRLWTFTFSWIKNWIYNHVTRRYFVRRTGF